MSLIRLVSVVGFRWSVEQNKPIIVFGAENVRYDNAASQWVFKATNIPIDLPDGRLPGGGRTFFYGFQDAIKEIAHWQSVADRDDLFLHSCYINIEIGEIYPALMGKEDLAHGYRFASMRRFKTDLLDEVLDLFREKTQRPSVGVKGMARYMDIASTPWLVQDLLNMPEYEKIDVMVFPALTGRGVKSFAFVRNECQIQSLEQNTQQPWRIEI